MCHTEYSEGVVYDSEVKNVGLESSLKDVL